MTETTAPPAAAETHEERERRVLAAKARTLPALLRQRDEAKAAVAADVEAEKKRKIAAQAREARLRSEHGSASAAVVEAAAARDALFERYVPRELVLEADRTASAVRAAEQALHDLRARLASTRHSLAAAKHNAQIEREDISRVKSDHEKDITRLEGMIAQGEAGLPALRAKAEAARRVLEEAEAKALAP